jgi:hypothetical protein
VESRRSRARRVDEARMLERLAALVVDEGQTFEQFRSLD